MANKITFDFRVIEEYAERLDRLGGDIKQTVEEALVKSHEYITPQIQSDMERHHITGDTEEAIATEEKVRWEGATAVIDVGFHISNGGLPSVFLMYGTPRMDKDQKLYNDVYGASTKRAIKEIQEEIFTKAIRERMEG